MTGEENNFLAGDGAHVGAAGIPLGALGDIIELGDGDGSKDADDYHHDHKLDQGEALFLHFKLLLFGYVLMDNCAVVYANRLPTRQAFLYSAYSL